MKKFVTFLSLFISFIGFSQTPIGGTVSTNTTYTLANSPYQVVSSLTVNSGVTLTIESGVELQFNDNLELQINGILSADGVTFTSANASPVAGSWQGIDISSNSAQTFTNCQVLYAQTGIDITQAVVDISASSFTSSQYYGVYSDHSVTDLRNNITANNVTVAGAGSYGIYVDRANLTLSNSSISGVTGQYGIYFDDNLVTGETTAVSSSTVSNTTISDGTKAGIALGNGNIDFTDLTVSNSQYPISYLGSANATYSGTTTFTNNDFNAILFADATIERNMTIPDAGYVYYFNGTKTIENGVELTIASGSIIKMHPSTTLNVEGKLIAVAATDEDITFTTWYDDNEVGDSNGDSNDTAPNTGKWQGIHFQNESDDSSLIDGVTIKWTQSYGGVTTYNASPTIENNLISNCYYGAMFNGVSTPTFSNNTIASSDRTPIAMSFDANPVFTDNIFSSSDNVYDAIGLLGGTLSQNGTIVKRNFTDIDNVTYVMLGSVNVPTGLSLNIDPGVVIKSESGQNFEIHGELIADGTPEEPIILTSVHDDNFGNPLDTKNDGTNQVPSVGNFGGIYFSETSVNTSLVDNTTIKFGNYGASYQNQAAPISGFGNRTYYYRSAIAINRSEPTISNSQIIEAKNGIDMRGLASPVITSNTITNTEFAPFRQAIQTTPAYTGNTFSSSGWKGVGILPELINYSATLNVQAVAGFDNVLYIMESMGVNETAEVTIGEGVFIKIPRSNKMEVFGGFKIAGTELDPVTITSMADDNTGPYTNPLDNDTEGNGNATEPTTEEWGSIHYYAISDDAFSSISHAKLLYGGNDQAPIKWDQAAASVDNTEISFSQNYGLYFEGASTPIIDNVSISTSRVDPLAMSYFANPTFTNITFNANGSNGINLIDTQLNADATIAKRDIAGINNIGYIMNSLSINNGATLTINPGVVLKLNGNRIDVYEGAINAVGTPSEKVIFTSIKDDSRGGDTNIDGNGTAPAPGNWLGIYFRESTLQSQLQYAEIRYGGDAENSSGGTSIEGTIVSENNNLIVDNCVIQLSNHTAFGAYGTSTATFTNNRLENISRFPVHMAMFSNPTFSGNTVENIGYFAIGIKDESYNQTATFPFRSFAGVDSITYMPVNVSSQYAALVNSGTKITIPAGMHFKSSSSYIQVNGELHIAGTTDDPVVFTTIKDDSYGRPRDTEGDGLPTAGQLYGSGTLIKFNNISDDNSLIENAIIRFSDQAVELASASPTLDNNLIENANWGIYSTGISEPTYTNNTFKDLNFSAFTTSMVAYPAATSGNTLEGTTWKTIHINNETLTQDTTLYKRSFAGINNIPYSFNTYTVGLGVKLTVEPGVIVKMTNNSRGFSSSANGSFTIEGALEANGGASTDESIIFTSMNDDFYGGDSNSDSTYTTSIFYEYSGIIFTNESSDSESILNNVVIRGAHNYGVELQSASPTISNTLFWDNGNSSNNGGLYVTGASNPTLSSNDFLDNGYISGTTHYGYGINNTGSFTVNAIGSWWGSNSGPYHETLNSSGEGDQVLGNVTFDPWETNNSQNPITGDVSLNGAVSAYDAALTLQQVAAIITFEARQDRAADVSGDGSVSAMDASYILQFAAGMIQSFPAEAENKRTEDNFVSTHSEAVVNIGNGDISTEYGEVNIPISLSNVKALHALSMKLPLGNYLELVEFVVNEELSFTPTLHLNEETNEFNLAFGLMNGLKEDAQLGVLKLKLNAEKVPVSAIDLNPSQLIGNETNISTLAENGKVYIAGAVLGTSEIDGDMRVYPNPTVEYATIVIPEFTGQKVEVQVIDVTGKMVIQMEEKLNNDRVELSNLNLQPGIYVIKVLGESKQFKQQLIIGQ